MSLVSSANRLDLCERPTHTSCYGLDNKIFNIDAREKTGHGIDWLVSDHVPHCSPTW